MNPTIKARFNDRMLAQIVEKYGVTLEDLTPLDGFESFIYEVHQPDRESILRVSHSERRSEALILGEGDWINYLAKHGAGASQMYHSNDGNLVEKVSDGHGEYFLGTLFAKAPGVPPRQFGWSDTLYETYGRTIGQLHRLSMDYTPSDPRAIRPQWDDPIMGIEASWMPAGNEIVLQKYQEIEARCRTLPQTREEYGLIHFDVHGGNFFVAPDGSLHLFDFDDCNYSWYANDIAIVLFYLVHRGEEDTAAFTKNFMTHFIRGYQQENLFNPEWLDLIPMFLKMREIDLYAVVHRSFDVENSTEPFVLWYMTGRQEKIENDVPYVDFDFRSLEGVLKA